MVCDVEVKNIPGHFLNLLDPWVTEFKDFSAILTDQVIVLSVFKRFFKLGYVFPKLMPGD